MSVESEITGKPPLDILFCKVEKPRDYPDFQKALDIIAEKVFGSNINPFGGKRFLLEWGGTAYRWFFKYKVPKYYRNKYDEHTWWAFSGDPRSRYKHERKVFFTDCVDQKLWPKRWEKYRNPTPLYQTLAWPYANWFVTFWMHPDKACKEWDEFMYGCPMPREGYYYPLLPIKGESTDHNPFGLRAPDTVDLQFVEKIAHEMATDWETQGLHIDQPYGESEINNFNYWLSRALQHDKDEAREKSRIERMEIIKDVLSGGKNKSFTSNSSPEIINPNGGKATRDVAIYMG